ncbi:MAG: FHA domain-containing protein [Phycisphaerae bacterium]|nr:FHA domain-containing protein [Phycisphaerae bacterium]
MDVKLILMKTDGQQKEFSLTKEVTLIGRESTCDLRIPIESCSRKQCELTIEGDKLMVRDAESSNGTFVNNERVTEAELSAGDRLTIGPIVLTVQIDGEPTEAYASTMYTSPAEVNEELVATNDTVTSLDDPLASLAGDGDEGEADDSVDALAAAIGTDEEEEDPIAALEALADIQQEEDEEKQ